MTYEIVPPNDNREEFVNSAIAILKQNKANITTNVIPLDWGFEIVKASELIGYKIRLEKVLVNLGEVGTAHAIFYFERQS